VPSESHIPESLRPEKEWATSGRRPATVYGSRNAPAGISPCRRSAFWPTQSTGEESIAITTIVDGPAVLDSEDNMVETTERREADFEQLPALIGCWMRTVKMAVRYGNPAAAFEAGRELAHLAARYLEMRQPSLFHEGWE
jgi:hypothetical protein